MLYELSAFVLDEYADVLYELCTDVLYEQYVCRTSSVQMCCTSTGVLYDASM